MATGTALKDLPIEPFAELLERRGGWAGVTIGDERDYERLSRAWRRARRSGRVTMDAADRLAAEVLGRHPFEVWGDDWLRVLGVPS